MRLLHPEEVAVVAVVELVMLNGAEIDRILRDEIVGLRSILALAQEEQAPGLVVSEIIRAPTAKLYMRSVKALRRASIRSRSSSNKNVSSSGGMYCTILMSRCLLVVS
jgi:hypothetical protein